MFKPRAVSDFEDVVRAHGCIITGQNDVELHHIFGRKYKHNKLLIGPWGILPICKRLHNVMSNHPMNVTHFRHRFTAEFGTQRSLFAKLLDNLTEAGILFEVPAEVVGMIALTKY